MKRTSLLLAAVFVFCHTLTATAQQGRDGQVNLLFWQAPSTLNPYLSGGLKDIEAASIVLEPLARHDATGTLVPWLAREIPSLENAGISGDRTSVTWRLREGLLWSDGQPVTSQDIRFTWSYCVAEGAGCAQSQAFRGITAIDTPDTLTAIIRFDAPRPMPFTAFVGATTPVLQEAQFSTCLGPRAQGCTAQNHAPVGTGPFVVREFRSNDIALFEANPNFRTPDKPAFSSLLIKGGSSADAAARAVLETGEFDYGWNLQLSPEVLSAREQGGRGKVVMAFGTLVERLLLNLTDPDRNLGEWRSTPGTPHPILSDKRVREALSLAIDRAVLTEIGYGPAGRVTCNIVPAPTPFASDANEACRVRDVARANALLDAAGWRPGPDGIRQRDGTRLSLLFQSSNNAVRQDFQALIKAWWHEIGIETNLRSIEASVFFGSDPDSPDTYQKFYADVQLYANRFDGTDPGAYLGNWRCSQIPSPETGWQGANVPRYCNDTYDGLVDQLAQTPQMAERAALARQLNDRLVQDFVLLPLVERGRVSAHAHALGGVVMNAWDSELWNVADWMRLDAQ